MAAEVLGSPPTPAGAPAAATAPTSFTASVHHRALPRELVERGLVRLDDDGDRTLQASYDLSLLAANPQRARVEDLGIEQLAASLAKEGQLEPVLARLLGPSDRARWPEAFQEGQRLLVLKGHRLLKAAPAAGLSRLRVSVLLPQEGESDLDYSRRALRRASVRIMQSQAYSLLDKVRLYQIWLEEFGLAAPKDQEVAGFFEISRTEAQRVKVAARLTEPVLEKLQAMDRLPADEVIAEIGKRPAEEQPDALRRYGHLTVAALRARLESEKHTPKALLGRGRPRNFVLRLGDENRPLVSIETALTPQQWRQEGGDRAFWKAIDALRRNPTLRDRVRRELAG